MSAHLKEVKMSDTADIAYQDASLDIWDKKYRLKTKDGDNVDQDMDATYQRVAKALSDVEDADKQEQWHEKFRWALRHGAIPAGRITSNAGALEHKPATSTINCTVSGIVGDSMDDIFVGKKCPGGRSATSPRACAFENMKVLSVSNYLTIKCGLQNHLLVIGGLCSKIPATTLV